MDIDSRKLTRDAFMLLGALQPGCELPERDYELGEVVIRSLLSSYAVAHQLSRMINYPPPVLPPPVRSVKEIPVTVEEMEQYPGEPIKPASDEASCYPDLL